MGKKWLIISVITIITLIIIICTTYMYNRENVADTNMIGNIELSKEEYMYDNLNEIVSTAFVNDTISPDAIIIEKRYYKGCDHLIREAKEIPKELVNKNKIDIEKEYVDWKVEDYSINEITVYKEFGDYCDEHYILREENGVVVIYTVNQEKVEKFQEETEIATVYLSEEDINRFKTGIEITGKMNLYSFLEDYE